MRQKKLQKNFNQFFKKIRGDYYENYSKKDEIVADPKLFLSALLERLKKENRSTNENIKSKIAEIKEEFKKSVTNHLEGVRNNIPLHTGFIVETIVDSIKKDAIVVTDVGNSQMWGRYYFPLNHTESYMQSGVWNAMVEKWKNAQEKKYI